MNDNEAILVARSYMPDKERVMEYLQSMWDTRWLSNGGPLLQQLEQVLSKRLKVDSLVMFSNGHMALDLAIRMFELEGEVITTPYTFVSTTNAIEMNGLTPVFCDIKESDGTIDEDKIEALITDKTCAIVPVHVYGFPCNYKRIQEIADRHGLKIIYDAAHAFNVEVDEKGIGTLGDLSMFSMHATKVYHTVEGGALAFNDLAYRTKLTSLKGFGLCNKEDIEQTGVNAKMSEMHAAMGLANLETIDWQIDQRRNHVIKYIELLKGMKGLRLFDFSKKNVKYNYAYFPIIIEDEYGMTRDELLELLAKNSIFARKYFYPLVSDMTYYKKKYGESQTPIAKNFADRILSLPIFVELTNEQIEHICKIIKG